MSQTYGLTLPEPGPADWPRFGYDLQNTRFNARESSLVMRKSKALPKEKAERWAAYQRVLDQVVREHPEYSKVGIREETAERCGCSVKTIQRRTEIRSG